MITALLLAVSAQSQQGFKVLELIEDSPYVVVQAYLKAPEMSARESASWQILGRVLLQGTEQFTPQSLRRYASQAGFAPQVWTMPDYMRVQIVLPRAGLTLAVSLMYSILITPSLDEDDVSETIKVLEMEQDRPWIASMTGISYDYGAVRKGDVARVWRRTVRPQNINFVVGGGIPPGAGKAEIELQFARFKPPRDVGLLLVDGPPTPLLSLAGGVSTFSLVGRTMTPASVASAAKLLAVFALGVGKDASMHRVLREDLGLSYMQTAVLWPTAKGWTPYLIMVRKSENEEARLVTVMKEALMKDIDGWSMGTVSRAKAMARAAFTRRLVSSPIWLDETGPMSQSLIDRCAWRGYLEMVGSGALREELLLGAMENVDLDQLKEQATALLEESNAGWLPGRG